LFIKTWINLLSTVMVSLVITVVEFDVFTVVVVVEDNSCLVTVFWRLLTSLFDVDVKFKLEFELKDEQWVNKNEIWNNMINYCLTFPNGL